MSIRGYGKVIVPGTTDRSIGVTNGDGCRGIVADHRIGSTDPDTRSGVNPDYNIGVNRRTGSRWCPVIIKDIWFKMINDVMDNGITVNQRVGEGQDIAVHSAGLGSCYVSIRGYGKVVVPGTTDRSIGVTNGDGCRGIVADHRIGSTDPDTRSGVNPDYNIGVNRRTGSRWCPVIIKDIWFKVINDVMNNGITVDQCVGEGQDIAVHGTALGSCYVSIRGYGKVVVPGTTYRGIWITDGDGCRSIVADHRIGSTDPDTGSGVNPDYNIGVNRRTGSRWCTVIIKDIWFKVINDLMDNSIVIGQGICIRSSRNTAMIGFGP